MEQAAGTGLLVPRERAGGQSNIPLSRSLKHFLPMNLGKAKEPDFNCLSLEGGFWNRLEQALDSAETISEQAKRGLGNSPRSPDPGQNRGRGRF